MSWPLRSIRRYGIDTDSKVFTFESGRRCPTGPGVYVFRCSRSQQLFERVQSYVRQNSGNGSADLVTTTRRSSTGQIIENIGGGGDTGSEPPISPRNPDAPTLQVPLNGQNSNQYVNVNVPAATAVPVPISLLTGTGSSATAEQPPVQLLQPQQQKQPQTQLSATTTDSSPVLSLLPPPGCPLPPNYENLILGSSNGGGNAGTGNASIIMPSGTTPSCPHSPLGAGNESLFPSEEFEVPIPPIPQIDYAVLELPECETNNNLDPNRFVNAEHSHDQTELQTGNGKDVTGSEDTGGPASSSITSANRPPDYALIDFDRTNALGQAVNTQQRDRQMSECGQEMGIRKTRHNSTLESICSTLQTSN